MKKIKNNKTGEILIAKIFSKVDVMRQKQVDKVYFEIQLFSELKHNLIANMIGLSQDSYSLYIIQEYINCGDLRELLCEREEFSPQMIKFYCAQILVVLEYLNSKSIVYRDLKPENILLTETGFMKLIDFGTAKKIEGKTYTVCGTTNYMAPELLVNSGHGFPVDYWSLGILLYEMAAGIDPFNDESPTLICQNILRGKIRFPRAIDKDLKSLIKHLLVADVNRRFNKFKDVSEHRYLKNYDFSVISNQNTDSSLIPSFQKNKK